MLSRGGDEEAAVCVHGVILPAYRGLGARRETKGKKEQEGTKKRERDEERETTTGIKYSQPQPERGLNCDQTRSRIPTAGGPTNRS